MCFTCTLEEVTGIDTEDLLDGWTPAVVAGISWPTVTDEMKLLARLRWVLYECTSAITGGPVHIFTDDYNVEDSSVEFCAKAINDPNFWGYKDHPEEADIIRAISMRIVELARPMTPAERAVALSLSWGELTLDAQGNIVR